MEEEIIHAFCYWLLAEFLNWELTTLATEDRCLLSAKPYTRDNQLYPDRTSGERVRKVPE